MKSAPPFNMRKYAVYIALIPLVLLALTPPWNIQLDCTVNGLLWLWCNLVAGFLAFLFLYQKVSVWIKSLLVWCFISCFLSRAPYISFTMFWSVILCAYYYVLCKHIKNWPAVIKAMQAIFFLVSLLIVMQMFGKDTLLNFGLKAPCVLGLIGNKMILGSFMCVLAPFLIYNPLNWAALVLIAFISASSGAVASIGAGLVTYVWKKHKDFRLHVLCIVVIASVLFAWNTGKFKVFGVSGRGPVWVKTCELIAKRPIGYGPATYKVIFPALCGKSIRDQQPGREWNTAHNDWLQIPFEVGIMGFFLFLGWIVSVVRKVKDPVKIAGVAILATNMAIHFPTRMAQSVLILIMYMAFLEEKEYGR